jgi:RNA polymerase sigma-70 factor (ECF subfamily)
MSTTKLSTALLVSALAASVWSFAVAAPEAPKSKAAGKEAKEDEVAEKTDNLLRNSGFEEGQDSPADWEQGAEVEGVEYAWDKESGKKGKASLSLHKTANRYFPIAQWSQVVERKGDGRTLEVSAQVKAERAAKATIDVIFLDKDDEPISHKWAAYIGAKAAKDPPANHDWKKYSGKVEIPPKTAKIQLALQIYGPGRVWFDEVSASYSK